MSPNVGNFVHDLVEMAKAMETLPQVQATLDEAMKHNNQLAIEVQAREVRILSLKQEIEALNEKVRASEVAKDAAETMFLEADDRTSRALDFIKTTFGNAGSLIQALEPPKPTPEPMPVQAMPEAAEVMQDQANPHVGAPISGAYSPTPNDVGGVASSPPLASPPMHEAQLEGTYFKPDWKQDQAETSRIAPQGQSESPLPAGASTPVQADAPTPFPVESNVGETASSPQPGPFAGKKYYDEPAYRTLSEWLAGGGTKDDYNWRPSSMFGQL